MTSVDACKTTRTTLKSRITSLLNKLKNLQPDTISEDQYQKLKSKALELEELTDSNYEEFMAASNQGAHEDVTKHYYEMQDRLTEIEEFLHKCEQHFQKERIQLAEKAREREETLQREKMQIEKELEEKRIEKGVPTTATPAQPAPIQRPKLPQLTLPTFDGKFEEWLPFRDRYNQAVHKRTDLSGAEKFTYLLAALQGKAAEAVKSIPISNENYVTAYDRVVKLFEHSREIAYKLADTIIDLPAMRSRTSDGIISITNTTSNALASIRAIDANVDLGQLLVSRLVTRKLDSVTLERFNQSRSDRTIPALQVLLDFLDCEMLTIQPATANSTTGVSTQPRSQTGGNNSTQPQREATPRKCLICGADHPHFKCPQLSDGPEKERRKLVDKAKLCTNCLSAGHGWRNCKSTRTCKSCNQKHHSLLHSSFAKTQPEKSSTLATTTPSNQSKLKPTAIIKIANSQNQGINCRALIDNCSDVTFIQESFVRALGLTTEKLPQKLAIEALQSKQVTTITECVTLDITSLYHPQIQYNVKAFVIKSIGGAYPQQKIDQTLWTHLPTSGLADPEYFLPKKVELLLSTDLHYEIIRSGIIRGLPGEPVAQESSLGWLIGGGTSTHPENPRCNLTDSLDSQLQRFWEVEHGPAEEVKLTIEEKVCQSHFENTTTRLQDGSYQVELPFKESTPPLGNSSSMALKRYYALESKFTRNPKLKTAYTTAFQGLNDDGHVELVPKEEIFQSPDKCYFLPHHAVYKESSSTTKLRIVFDASAKSSSGQSLNSKLMVGPVLQEDLIKILMRWRYWKVPLTADIEKMYLYILVHPKHRDYLRLYWRSNPTDPIRCYRLRKVTFGTASAPYQAVRTLQQLAQDHRQEYPEAAEVLIRDFYIDDGLSGANSTEEAITLCKDLRAITAKANFNLRKWSSSDPVVLDSIPVEARETSLPLSIDQDESTKALGLIWSPSQDEFRFEVKMTSPLPSTKRKILSEIAKVFDPLGFLAPVTVRAKCLMQELWKCQSGWDSKVPDHLLLIWSQYREEIQGLEKLRIPRWISASGAVRYQLHGFSDASERAYAASVYLRTITSTQTHVQLIAAKSRVAPAKEQSLPKLELCGAVLLSQLTTMVLTALRIISAEVFAYTDSTITLAWITAEQPQRWKTFVRNRVITIHEHVPPQHWHHVPGEVNPADLPSRGISVSDFLTTNIWFKGPEFLHASLEKPVPRATESHEGKVPHPKLKPEQLKLFLSERKPEQRTVLLTNQPAETRPDLQVITRRYSNWDHLRRHVAWWILVWRYHQTKQSTHIKCQLSPEDLQHAEERIVFFLQQSAFSREVEALEKKQAIPKKSPLLSLTPFLKNGLLRVGGRIKLADLTFDNRHPLLLPRHHVTDLVIQHLHLDLKHGGTSLTLSMLQRRFWVIRGRTHVRKCINRCKTCVIQRGATVHQLMADLPEPRVRMSPPFTHTGVDYAGPIQLRESLRRNAKTSKAYIAVFVCLCTKAVTLELVSDLTTSAFLAALKRFSSRRIKPQTIKSDNGTTFVGADRELQELFNLMKEQHFDDEVIRTLANSGTQWSFIPPAAPHQGGLWEAAVKSAKFHLRRVIGKSTLTFELYDTLLKEVEACLNSRPLCSISSDPNDFTALTPGHFLTGQPPMAIPAPDLTHLKLNRLDRWQHQQQLMQHFWKRWHSEYLQQLQRRTKWRNKEKNVEIGDLVVIQDDLHPPQFWKLGRVEKVHVNPSEDKPLIRTVTIKTATGSYKRPVTKLVLLPKSTDDEE